MKYLPLFIVGSLGELVSYVKKTIDLVDEADKRQSYNYKRSLSEVLLKAPYHGILHTVIPRMSIIIHCHHHQHHHHHCH